MGLRMRPTLLTSLRGLNCQMILISAQWMSLASTQISIRSFLSRKSPLSPSPTRYLKEYQAKSYKKTYFQFSTKDYLQTHENEKGQFANIFMANIDILMIRQQKTPLVWKRFTDDVFFLWNTSTDEVKEFPEKANSFHPTINFTAEISEVT